MALCRWQACRGAFEERCPHSGGSLHLLCRTPPRFMLCSICGCWPRHLFLIFPTLKAIDAAVTHRTKAGSFVSTPSLGWCAIERQDYINPFCP